MTLPVPDTYSDVMSSYMEPTRNNRIRADLPESFATTISKRIFQWLYSFSLIIFIILTAAFIVVTPLDIIVQTYGAPSTGIKMFIIIAACAIFLVALIFFYFSRLFKTREAVNQIPSKSVYVPLEKHDLPADVLKYIDKQLKKCVGDIKVRAGPLHNKDASLNYPGMSPPEYIQERNIRMGYHDQGTMLPPNCVYEEIIDSLALRIRFDGELLTNFRIPTSFTFREVIVSMFNRLSELHQHQQETIANLHKVVELYEKFRYGPDLITERDLVAFLLAMENFSLNFIQHRPDYDFRKARSSLFDTGTLLTPFRGLGQGGISDGDYRADIESLVVPYNPTQPVSRASTRLTRTSTGNSMLSCESSTSLRRYNSSGSVIKNRLAYRRPSSAFHVIGENDEASLRAYSGYLTDSEDDRDTLAT